MTQLIGIIILVYMVIRLIQVESETAILVAMAKDDHDTLRSRQGTIVLLSAVGVIGLLILGLILVTSGMPTVPTP